MAGKAIKGSRSRKKAKEEEILEVETVDNDEEELENDETELEDETVETEDDEVMDEDEVEDLEEDIEATLEDLNDEFKSVNVLVIKDVPRFLIGNHYHEPLHVDQKTKLPKYVAEHLQERGRVKIV